MFTTKDYEIDIDYCPTYKSGSADNTFQYDAEYLEDSGNRPSSIFGIKLLHQGKCIKSAIISSEGGETGIHNTALVIKDDRLVLCCADKVFCLSIPDLSLLWKTKADDFTCFEIFSYQDSYIIHGEINISRINHDGTILWQYSGEDIFMNMDDAIECELRADYIMATDFSNKVYRIGYDGKDHN
jgi:outer membrane protein assembly factor BamB